MFRFFGVALFLGVVRFGQAGPHFDSLTKSGASVLKSKLITKPSSSAAAAATTQGFLARIIAA